MVTMHLKDAQLQLHQDSRAPSDRVRALFDDIEQNRDAALRGYAMQRRKIPEGDTR